MIVRMCVRALKKLEDEVGVVVRGWSSLSNGAQKSSGGQNHVVGLRTPWHHYLFAVLFRLFVSTARSKFNTSPLSQSCFICHANMKLRRERP